ncbi:MAG: hypothetical protein ACOX0A_01595 [Thermoguttaceae bacterium]
MKNRTFALALATSFLMCATTLTAHAAEYTVKRVAELYEAQWDAVNAMRLDFRREIRTRTAKNDYDSCSWEMIGEKTKVIEGRFTRLLSDPLDPDSLPIVASVVSKSYYDGTKTYELTEPIDAWPIEEFDLSEYEEYRRRGARATISNRNKLWRFWYSCPIPRYFMIPSETELLTLTQLTEKYPSRIIKRTRSDRGDNLIQLEIRNDAVVGTYSSIFKAWALYISLNIDKNFAVAGYQLSVTPNRDPQKKVFTEYSVGNFKEFPHGIWLPTNVEYREHSGGSRSALTRIAIRGVAINVPSPDFDDFKFLPGMVVNEEVWDLDEKKVWTRPEVRVHIWGKDDAPERTFESVEEFRKFFADEYGIEPYEDSSNPGFKLMGRRRNALAFFGSCVCLIAFIMLVFYTRRSPKPSDYLELKEKGKEA